MKNFFKYNKKSIGWFVCIVCFVGVFVVGSLLAFPSQSSKEMAHNVCESFELLTDKEKILNYLVEQHLEFAPSIDSEEIKHDNLTVSVYFEKGFSEGTCNFGFKDNKLMSIVSF